MLYCQHSTTNPTCLPPPLCCGPLWLGSSVQARCDDARSRRMAPLLPAGRKCCLLPLRPALLLLPLSLIQSKRHR